MQEFIGTLNRTGKWEGSKEEGEKLIEGLKREGVSSKELNESIGELIFNDRWSEEGYASDFEVESLLRIYQQGYTADELILTLTRHEPKGFIAGIWDEIYIELAKYVKDRVKVYGAMVGCSNLSHLMKLGEEICKHCNYDELLQLYGLSVYGGQQNLLYEKIMESKEFEREWERSGLRFTGLGDRKGEKEGQRKLVVALSSRATKRIAKNNARHSEIG